MRLSVAIAVACLILVGLSAADESQASIKKHIDIPAEGLGTALQTLAKDRKFQIVYVSEEINALRTQGAVGEFTPDEALKQLLNGTGLTFRYLDEKTVTVIPIATVAPPAEEQGDSQKATEKDSAIKNKSRAVAGDSTKSLWERFRLAQVDQGKASSPSSVGSQASNSRESSNRSSSGPSQPSDKKDEKLDEIVVTGVFQKINQAKASVAISTVTSDEVGRLQPLNAIDLLSNVPGVYVNSAQGVISFLNVMGTSPVSSRGLGLVQFEEDGLPLLGEGSSVLGGGNPLINNSGFNLMRSDLTLDHIEVVRGGSAAITGANAPGGLFNYLSKTGSDVLSAETAISYGLQGNGKLPYERADFDVGGPLLGEGWHFNVGGYYQHDYGARDAGYPQDYGGQLKANIVKQFENGSVEIYGKYLNDHNAYSQLIPGVDWNSPHPAAGWSNTSSMLLNPVSFGLRTGPNSYVNFDNKNLEHFISKSVGFKVAFDLGGGWSLDNNLKYSSSRAESFIVIDTATDQLTDPLNYVLLGSVAIPGIYTFTDPANGRSAQVLSKGGQFTVLNNNLPGTSSVPNGIYLESPYLNTGTVSEFQDQLIMTKSLETKAGHMAFTVGGYYDHSYQTSGEPGAPIGDATLTPRPQMLDVTVVPSVPTPYGPAGTTLRITNPAGFPSTAAFIQGAGYSQGWWNQLDVFFAHHWDWSGWALDWGMRYEEARSNGFVANAGTPITTSISPNVYADSYIAEGSGPTYDAQTRFHTLAYSVAINREINDNNSVYFRYTDGKNAPGVITYSSAAAEAATPPPAAQEIVQYELGYKFNRPRYSIALTPYYSVLSKTNTDVIYAYLTGSSTAYSSIGVLTPVNKTSDLGIELDGRYRFDYGFALRTAFTWQKSKEINSYNWVQPPGVIGPAKDPTLGSTLVNENAGYRAADIPDFMAVITPSYSFGPFLGQIQWQYMGSREVNNNDAFAMPAYNQTNLTLQWNCTDKLSLSFIENNVFNSGGIATWGAPGNILSTINSGAYTRAQRQADPNAVFYIQQIPARAFFLRLNYHL